MTKFSPKYSTFQDWKQANPGKSEYTERIRLKKVKKGKRPDTLFVQNCMKHSRMGNE